MAMSKTVQAALKALSKPDINMKKNYELVRKVTDATHPPYRRPHHKKWDHVIIREDHVIPLRIFAGDEVKARPLLIFFHGGGWVTGNIDSYDRVCAHMAELTGRNVISVDYRLAPEYKFPCGLMDCYTVMQDVLSDPSDFGIDVSQVAVIGDSAGANLAAAASLMARDRGGIVPDKQILIYPAVYNDFSDRSPFASIKENGTDYILTSKRMVDYMDLYVGKEEDLSSPYLAPYLAEDLKNQPDTLIITAEYCPLRDEGEAYGRRLLEAGNKVCVHRVPDALHGFFSQSPKFRAVQEAYEQINAFLAAGRVTEQKTEQKEGCLYEEPAN